MGIGKSRPIRGYSASSGISVKDHYMQRTEADKYQVLLNINFILGETGKTSPADMMKKVKGCLEIATPNLWGPDGSTLHINALTPDEAEALPKKLDPLDVKIEGGMRANAEMYTDELNCGEITHEILHLLGLCDEYKEPPIVAGNTYACRVVPEVSTIMKNPRIVYARAIARELTCKCDENCKCILGLSDENLKKIYVAPNIYDAVDVDFRTKFCKPPQVISGLVDTQSLTNPDRAMSLLIMNAQLLLIKV